MKTPKPHTRNPRPTRIVPCTQCKVRGWPCDGNEPCENCQLRNKYHNCKHVLCKYYAKNTCSNTKCDMVHEDDEQCTYVVPWTKVAVKKVGPSPKEMTEKERLSKVKKEKEERSEGKTVYDLMFHRLDKSRKEGKDDDGGSATV